MVGERGTVGEVGGEYCGIRQVKSLLFPVKLARRARGLPNARGAKVTKRWVTQWLLVTG